MHDLFRKRSKLEDVVDDIESQNISRTNAISSITALSAVDELMKDDSQVAKAWDIRNLTCPVVAQDLKNAREKTELEIEGLRGCIRETNQEIGALFEDCPCEKCEI